MHAARCCLTTPAGDYLSKNGVAVSLINTKLQRAALTSQPALVHLEQAVQVHTFLLQQQRLRRITSAALVLESTPEALVLDVQQHLRPLLACLQELGLSQEQTTQVFRALRRHRQHAASFLQIPPDEVRRRWFWLSKNLALEEGRAAAAYLAACPSLLLAEPAQAAAVVRWLYNAAGWRRQAVRRNLARVPAILLTPLAQLEAAAQHLQCQLDASVDELCLLLRLAPRLLGLPLEQLAAEVAEHPTSWQLSAAWMDRPPIMMKHAAETLHMQQATLYLMSKHSWSRQQVADLVRDYPSVIRSVRLE